MDNSDGSVSATQCSNELSRSLVSLFGVAAWLMFAGVVAAVLWSWFRGGLVYSLLDPGMASEEKIRLVRTFLTGFGPAAPLVYFLFVMAEVIVAPLPGLMLYAPGGMLFGALGGGGIALAGNVAGAGIACQLTRTFGERILKRFFEPQQIVQMQTVLERHGMGMIILLRLNPLTSSDLVSYAAGFSRLPVWKVMLATACGMAPLCFGQAWLSENLLTRFPALLYAVVILLAVYLAVVVRVFMSLVGGTTSSCIQSVVVDGEVGADFSGTAGPTR